MRTFRLNKLVRDNLVTLMEEIGQQVKFRTLDDAEYFHELKRKLIEETAELDLAASNALAELADVQAVIDALVAQLGATPDDFKKVQQERINKKGALGKRLYIETVTTQDDDEWARYYSKEPERFPEEKTQ